MGWHRVAAAMTLLTLEAFTGRSFPGPNGSRPMPAVHSPSRGVSAQPEEFPGPQDGGDGEMSDDPLVKRFEAHLPAFGMRLSRSPPTTG